MAFHKGNRQQEPIQPVLTRRNLQAQVEDDGLPEGRAILVEEENWNGDSVYETTPRLANMGDQHPIRARHHPKPTSIPSRRREQQRSSNSNKPRRQLYAHKPTSHRSGEISQSTSPFNAHVPHYGLPNDSDIYNSYQAAPDWHSPYHQPDYSSRQPNASMNNPFDPAYHPTRQSNTLNNNSFEQQYSWDQYHHNPYTSQFQTPRPQETRPDSQWSSRTDSSPVQRELSQLRADLEELIWEQHKARKEKKEKEKAKEEAAQREREAAEHEAIRQDERLKAEREMRRYVLLLQQDNALKNTRRERGMTHGTLEDEGTQVFRPFSQPFPEDSLFDINSIPTSLKEEFFEFLQNKTQRGPRSSPAARELDSTMIGSNTRGLHNTTQQPHGAAHSTAIGERLLSVLIEHLLADRASSSPLKRPEVRNNQSTSEVPNKPRDFEAEASKLRDKLAETSRQSYNESEDNSRSDRGFNRSPEQYSPLNMSEATRDSPNTRRYRRQDQGIFDEQWNPGLFENSGEAPVDARYDNVSGTFSRNGENNQNRYHPEGRTRQPMELRNQKLPRQGTGKPRITKVRGDQDILEQEILHAETSSDDSDDMIHQRKRAPYSRRAPNVSAPDPPSRHDNSFRMR